MELKNDFELSPFDYLSEEHMDFLITFLRHEGNLRGVQSELDISYPFAKKKLEQVLVELGLNSKREQPEPEVIDMTDLQADPTSIMASEIIKGKLKDSGGRVIVGSISGKTYEIKPMFGYYFCEFWNEETDYSVVGGVKLNFGNVRRGLYIDRSITLSELPTAQKNSFIVVLPEEHLIVAYEYDDQIDGADWMADCWVLACDVDDAGMLQCHGVFCETFSNGMRVFCEAAYSISAS